MHRQCTAAVQSLWATWLKEVYRVQICTVSESVLEKKAVANADRSDPHLSLQVRSCFKQTPVERGVLRN